MNSQRSARDPSSRRDLIRVLPLLPRPIVAAPALLLLSACVSSHAAAPSKATPKPNETVTRQIVAAANSFLATLNDTQRAAVSLPLNQSTRAKWSNFPIGFVPRNGVRWGDLSQAQRDSALQLLAVALSPSGLQKTRAIMEGDEVLKSQERDRPPPPGPPPDGKRPPPDRPGGFAPQFGHDEYYLAFLDSPSVSRPWMIQFGGHHLALNLTIVGNDNVLTPSLPAAQPATYELNGKVVRPLGRESDAAFALINALDARQQKLAILEYQVSDLVLGPGQDGKTIEPEGIRATELGATQRRMLLALIREWVGIVNDAAAIVKMSEIEANLDRTWFAWSGPTRRGGAAYFRVQGPTVIIEYAPQRRFGERGLNADHVHTIYRDPSNDYGARGQ